MPCRNKHAKNTINFRYFRHADRPQNKTALQQLYRSDSIEYTVGSKATTDNVSTITPPLKIHKIPESGLPRTGWNAEKNEDNKKPLFPQLHVATATKKSGYKDFTMLKLCTKKYRMKQRNLIMQTYVCRFTYHSYEKLAFFKLITYSFIFFMFQ